MRMRIWVAAATATLAVASVVNAGYVTPRQSPMTAYWPDSTSGCRVDLTTASAGQIVKAIYCLKPHGGVDANIPWATEVWQMARGLRWSS